jgi:hypothetical protein
VVDSFAVSVTLMLTVVGFARMLRRNGDPPVAAGPDRRVGARAGRRLTAALVGLLRSFSVNVFSVGDPQGRQLLHTVDQELRPERVVLDELRAVLREINARLRDDVTIGSGAAEGSKLDLPNRDRCAPSVPARRSRSPKRCCANWTGSRRHEEPTTDTADSG